MDSPTERRGTTVAPRHPEQWEAAGISTAPATLRSTLRVALIAKADQAPTGVGRYVRMLSGELGRAGVEIVPVTPAVPPMPGVGYRALRRLGIDLRAFLSNYPVWASLPRAEVYHLSSQNLASLLVVRRPRGLVVVTVHDIIPYLLRRNPRLRPYRTLADSLFDRLAMAGLRRADRLIADSAYTARCLVEQLGVAPDTIDVVHLGIDGEQFRSVAVSPDFGARYGLAADRRYLIYVGSEDPRKNLPTLLRALAEVRREHADVELIKVGRAHFDAQRQSLLGLADELGIRSAVHFLDDVSEGDLPRFYSLATVAVMPSLYEGFGFPVLEAMACGTPVICARAASLPELVGDAALCFEPGVDVKAVRSLAEAIRRVLADASYRDELRAAGQARAATFQWSRCAERVIEVYRRGMDSRAVRRVGGGLS